MAWWDLSPIAVQRETIGTGLGMQDYAGRFFANDSEPSMTWIEYPGKFKDDAAREKFREITPESPRREDHRHKLMLLEQGMTAKAIGLTNRDSQFLEARTRTAVRRSAGMFRMPPHKIGILDRATNSNIEHQNIGLRYRHACDLRAVRWERRINVDLIDPMNEVLRRRIFRRNS